MSTAARNRSDGGAFAALLIFLGLLLGPGGATALPTAHDASARKASLERSGAMHFVRSGEQNTLSQEEREPDPLHPAPPPTIHTEALAGRPATDAAAISSPAVSQPAPAHYRARAPPAA